MSGYRHLRLFKEVGIEDVASVGGKNASLGEMYRALTPRGAFFLPRPSRADRPFREWAESILAI